MQLFGKAVLDALTRAAEASPRRRQNLNLHESSAHPAHRFFNAMEPHSYVRPHRHLDATKDETFVAPRGAFGLIVFADNGEVAESAVLRPDAESLAAHVPHSVFHSAIALEPGSIFFEVKAGPYDPHLDKDWAPWAPPEGDAAAAAYLAQLYRLFERHS